MLILLALGCIDYALEDEPKAPAPELTVLPAPLDARVCPGSVATVDLLNEGTGPLIVASLAVEGSGWTLVEIALPVVLAPGQALPVELVGDGGDAVLVVATDDADEPTVEVPIAAARNVSPLARVVSPVEEAVVPAEGDLEFVAYVGDEDDALADLGIEWTSSLVGSIGTSVPAPDGRITLVWPEEERLPGPQFVYLTVRDPCGAQAQGLAWYCQDGPYVVRPIVDEGWRHEGAARLDGDVLTLTEATADSVGASFDLATLFDGDDVEIRLEFQIGGGTGGEGLSVTLLDANEREAYVGGGGCGLGFGGGADCTDGPALPGWSLAIDTADDDVADCVPGPHLGFTVDGDLAGFGPCAPIPQVADGAWHTLHLRIADGRIVATLDGVGVMDDALPAGLDFQGYIGFTASTTDATNAHRVREVEVIDYTCVE